MRQERQRQELMKNYLFDTDVPIKVIFTGPAFSGKTTLLKSLRQYANKQKGILGSLVKSKEPSIEPERDSSQIVKDFKKRTIGIEHHLLKVEKDLYLNMQDLGGQESFYTLHSIFLHSEDSIFFVIFNLENPKEQIIEDVSNQLKIILSHCSSTSKRNIVFLGTHLDQVANRTVKEQETECLLRQLEEKFNIVDICDIIFLNAKDPPVQKMADIVQSIRKLASRIRENLVSALRIFLI